MIDVKRAVSESRRVTMTHVHAGNMWYKTEFGETFPVPIEDMGEATFHCDEKALLLMRYMRKWNDAQDA